MSQLADAAAPVVTRAPQCQAITFPFTLGSFGCPACGHMFAPGQCMPETTSVCPVCDIACSIPSQSMRLVFERDDRVALRDWLRERLAPYKLPGEVRELASMPLLSIGKLAKQMLREELYPTSQETHPCATPP